MDTTYCEGSHGSIKPYSNNRGVSNCQCYSIQVCMHSMQAQGLLTAWYSVMEHKFQYQVPCCSLLHQIIIFQVFNLSPSTSNAHPHPILPFPFCFKSLHSLPPTHYPVRSVAIPSTSSLSSLHQYISPFYICQPSLLTFIPPSLLHHPLTILHHLFHPKWSHCKLLLPS